MRLALAAESRETKLSQGVPAFPGRPAASLGSSAHCQRSLTADLSNLS